MIGSGSYGRVYKAQDGEDGRLFAVKEAAIEGDGEGDRTFVDSLVSELEICSSLRHPNIISCLGHERLGNSVCIFLEYAPRGSVANMLSEFGPLGGGLLQSAVRGSLQGLSYLHNHNPPVVHRDIKAANLLVDMEFTVKLADFGCSKRSTSTQSFKMVGSVPWMAPEVMLQKDGHGRKADIWSFGCTVLEMATAEKPWGDNAFRNIAAAMMRISMPDAVPPIPERLPEACRDFVGLCTRRPVEERPGANSMSEHRYLGTLR